MSVSARTSNLLYRSVMPPQARVPKCSRPLVQHTGLALATDPRLVRSALMHLLEDPPLSLGSSQLAVGLFPQLAALQRGEMLQRALLSAIEGLRPAQATTRDNRRSWPYLICRAEYRDGLCRREVERRMAMSTSSYTRAKRQALGRIAALLPLIVVQLTDASFGATNWSALVAHLRLLVEIASVCTPPPEAAQADQHLLARMIGLQETLREVLLGCAAVPLQQQR